jgi:uridine phosphorylase
LGALLGHHTLSLNAIIANRPMGEFSQNPNQVIENLIDYTLERIIKI